MDLINVDSQTMMSSLEIAELTGEKSWTPHI